MQNEKEVYIDHAATTPCDARVLEVMLPYFGVNFGNPSSIHHIGQHSKMAIEDSRAQVALLIGARPEEIVFTSGGTESNNLALQGAADSLRHKGKHIITSAVEHKAVLEPCHFLEKRGFEITIIPVDKHGRISPDDVKNNLRDNTILVSVMHANNEVGTIQPVEEIGKVLRERGILFHTDAVQSAGNIPVDVNALRVDMLSISSHKIYGPKGTGALFIRKGKKISRVLHGGSHERNRRAGTENVPGIVGFGKACELAKNELDERMQHVKALREEMRRQISLCIPDVFFTGHPEKRLPNNLSLCVDSVEGESIIVSLDLKGICVSSGSACMAGALEPSHVLTAMGVPAPLARSAVRFTFGKQNTMEHVNLAITALKEITEHVRSLMPAAARA